MNLKLIKFKCVKSTNDVAIRYIKKGLLKPTIIVAEKQTNGRGTMGKKWMSLKGNLFFSIYFEISKSVINLKQFTRLNAFSIKKSLVKNIDSKISIKWPNDLMIKKQKVCGILQETVTYKNFKFLIVGVGINTNLSPSNIKGKATFLKKFSKKRVNNKKILVDIKKTYEKFIDEINIYRYSYLRKKFK